MRVYHAPVCWENFAWFLVNQVSRSSDDSLSTTLCQALSRALVCTQQQPYKTNVGPVSKTRELRLRDRKLLGQSCSSEASWEGCELRSEMTFEAITLHCFLGSFLLQDEVEVPC